MQFMVMHKMTAEMEKGLPPEPEIIAGVGELIGSAASSKAFLSGAGLKPSALRTHLVYRGGVRTATTDGPSFEVGELVGSFAMISVASKEEALAACDQLAAAVGDTEMFLGPVVEPWDLGYVPRPEAPPMRFLALSRISARAEAEEPIDPAAAVREKAALDALERAGVLQSAGRLASTKRSTRIRKKAGHHVITDGPFAETKELVAGYAILELPSKEAAVEWGVRFFDVVRVEEVDVRPLVD